MGESVLRAAVDDQLPVRPGGAHLVGERADISERDVRV
jgi:hypothetical protein